MGFFRSFPKKKCMGFGFSYDPKSTENSTSKQFLEMLGIYFVHGWEP